MEDMFENGCKGWAVVDSTVLFAIVITRPPLAGRSELVRSTHKSCRLCGRHTAGSIYIGVREWWKKRLWCSLGVLIITVVLREWWCRWHQGLVRWIDKKVQQSLTNQRVSYAFTSSPFSYHPVIFILPNSRIVILVFYLFFYRHQWTACVRTVSVKL